jgi:multiple sugar transport system substrate-binding protein
MHQRNELSEDEQKQFETDNPGITMEFVVNDTNRLSAMLAAGNPPDVWRTSGTELPRLLLRKLVMDLTPFFSVSQVLKIDDLAPANKAYYAVNPLTIGEGKIYGMVKDWGPHHNLFVNTEFFSESGAAVPPTDQSISYAEVMDLARKTALFEGDRVLRWGFGGDFEYNPDHFVTSLLAETAGKSPNPYAGVLYSEAFDRITISSNPDAVSGFDYLVQLARENLVSNPINPSTSWNGQDFADGKMSIVQWGYWFSGMAETDNTREKVVMLPSPYWSQGGKRLDYSTTTGMVISATTQVPDAAWKVFEWYNGQEPALARAQSGWGVPGLKSLYEAMPQTTPFQKNCFQVLMDEIEDCDCESPILACPFGDPGFATSWTKNLDLALREQISLEEMLLNIETEVNNNLQDLISRYG